jgi:hypothetical protein
MQPSADHGTWPLPAPRDDDEDLGRRLASSGAHLSPTTRWDIDCMNRVVARELDAAGLLDARCDWLQIRHSRSQMAGGLTVEFAPHPDEFEPVFLGKPHLFFRFRESRPARSEEALAALREASARRRFLMRRADAVAAGTLGPQGALFCDAVLRGYLRSVKKDDAWLAALLADRDVVDVRLPIGDGESRLRVARQDGRLRVHLAELVPGVSYHGAAQSPKLVVRNHTWTDDELEALAGRDAHDVLPLTALDVPGLVILKASASGDAATLLLSRPSTILEESRVTAEPQDVVLHPEPHMASAGAELVALAWRLKQHPDFAGDFVRVLEIGSWVSMERMSDLEKGLIKVVGSLVGTMRSRNLEFREDLPMEPQFVDFLQSLPDPLPGQKGYVDQNTLPPVDRRDTFEAEVDIADVRTWTAGDGVPRAVARACNVRPAGGVACDTMVFAEGDLSTQLEEGTTRTLKLRSYGGSLRIEA